MTPHEKAAQHSRHLLPLVAIALIGCLCGCENEPDAAPLPSAGSPTTEAHTATPLPDSGDTRPAIQLPDSGGIDAGTYFVTSFTVPFEITVPDGWTSDGDGLFKDDPDHPDEWGVYLTFWQTDHVPTDACAWRGALVEVDPSAQAFVDAMAAQTSTASTPPVEVVVGEYSGFEFDHSVEDAVDMTACDDDKICPRSSLSNWCTRWYSSVDERETYRAFDLDGELAVMGLTYFHESINPELTEEARAVFDSIVFRSDN